MLEKSSFQEPTMSYNRRRFRQADDRRRQRPFHDHAVQCGPAETGRRGHRDDPRRGRESAGVRHADHFRRHVDGHRGHEVLADLARGDRRLHRDVRERAVDGRRRRDRRLRQEHAGRDDRAGAHERPRHLRLRRYDPAGALEGQGSDHRVRVRSRGRIHGGAHEPGGFRRHRAQRLSVVRLVRRHVHGEHDVVVVRGARHVAAVLVDDGQSGRREDGIRGGIGARARGSRQARPEAARHHHATIHRERGGADHGDGRLHERRAALPRHRARGRGGMDDRRFRAGAPQGPRDLQPEAVGRIRGDGPAPGGRHPAGAEAAAGRGPAARRLHHHHGPHAGGGTRARAVRAAGRAGRHPPAGAGAVQRRTPGDPEGQSVAARLRGQDLGPEESRDHGAGARVRRRDQRDGHDPRKQDQPGRRARAALPGPARRPRHAGDAGADGGTGRQGARRIRGPDHGRPVLGRNVGHGRGPRGAGSVRGRHDRARAGRGFDHDRRAPAADPAERAGRRDRAPARGVGAAGAALHPRRAGQVRGAGAAGQQGGRDVLKLREVCTVVPDQASSWRDPISDASSKRVKFGPAFARGKADTRNLAVLLHAFLAPLAVEVMGLALVEAQHLFDELEPDEARDHQAGDPPPGEFGEAPDFEIAQDDEGEDQEDQWHVNSFRAAILCPRVDRRFRAGRRRPGKIQELPGLPFRANQAGRPGLQGRRRQIRRPERCRRQAGCQGPERWFWRVGPGPDAGQPASQRSGSAHAGQVGPGAELGPLAALVREQRQRAILDVAVRVELDGAGHAFVLDVLEHGQVLRRIGRLRVVHRRRHHHHGIVDVRRVQLHVHVELLLVAGAEVLHDFLLRALHAARFRAIHLAFAEAVAGEAAQRVRAHAVAAHEHGLDAQRLHLLEHRARDGIHAAEEDQVRLLRLDRREDRRVVGGRGAREFAADDLDARFFQALREFVRDALAVRRAVVDDGDVFRVQRVDRILAQRAAQLRIAGDDAERAGEMLARVHGRRRGGRDLHDAGVVVDLRRGHGGAGIQVADDAVDLRVDEFLRDRRALFGIGAVVLGHELQRDLLAVQREALRVQLVDRHARGVLVVLAEVGAGAGDGRHVADLDDLLRACRAGEGEGERQGNEFRSDLHSLSRRMLRPQVKLTLNYSARKAFQSGERSRSVARAQVRELLRDGARDDLLDRHLQPVAQFRREARHHVIQHGRHAAADLVFQHELDAVLQAVEHARDEAFLERAPGIVVQFARRGFRCRRRFRGRRAVGRSLGHDFRLLLVRDIARAAGRGVFLVRRDDLEHARELLEAGRRAAREVHEHVAVRQLHLFIGRHDHGRLRRERIARHHVRDEVGAGQRPQRLVQGVGLRGAVGQQDELRARRQRVDLRFAAAEGLERVERRARAAHGQDLAVEALARLVEQRSAARFDGFLERRIRVRRQHLGPLVAVIAGRVAAREDVAERMLEAVERRRDQDGELVAHVVDEVLHRLLAVRVEVVVQVHVDQRELHLAQGLHAGLEVLRREHLVVQRARQRLARLHVRRHALQDVPLPAEVFHELRRQFDGIPFHARDAGDGQFVHFRQHVVQAVAEFMEQRRHFVVREQRWLQLAVAIRRRRREVAGQVGDRRLHDPAGGEPTAARVVHPRALAFAGTRVQVEVELADELTILFDAIETHVRMPHGRVVRRNRHVEQFGDQAEQARDDLRLREVFLHFLGGERVALLSQLFRRVRDVPRLHVGDAQFVPGERAQLGQVLLGIRTGAAREVFQELDHVFRRLGHLRFQRDVGKALEVQQFRLLVAQFQELGDVARVVPFLQFREHGAHLGRLGGVGAVDLFAQLALVGELQDREVGREVQAELPARLAVPFRRGAGGRLDVVRQAGQVGLVRDEQLVVVGRVQHVFREARGQLRLLFLDLGEAFLLLFRQLGAAQAEVAQRVVDDALARRRERRETGARAQLLVFAEQGFVLAQLRPELGDLRLVLVVGGTQLGRVHHVVQVVDHAPGTAEAFRRFLERDDEVVPRDVVGRRFGLLHGGACRRDQLLDRGRHVFRADQVEPGQPGKVEEGIGRFGRHHLVLYSITAILLLGPTMRRHAWARDAHPTMIAGRAGSPGPCGALRAFGDAFGRLQRILQQHRDGHRPHATRHRRDVAGDFLDAVEVDVAAQLALVVAVDAHVDDDGARLDHVAGQRVAAADGGHDDVRLAGVVAQVRRTAMADGDGGVLLQEQQRHRLADRVAAADDDGVLAAQVDAGRLDQLHAAVRRARAEAFQAGHQFAGGQHGIAVHVLAGRDGFDDFRRVDVLRQRHLDEDAVDGRIRVQRGDTVEQRLFREVGLVFFQHRVEAHVAARLDLVAHVDVAGGIVADDDHGQAGLVAGGGEGGGARGDVGAQLLGKFDSVDQLGGHGGDSCAGQKRNYKRQQGYRAPPAGVRCHIYRRACARRNPRSMRLAWPLSHIMKSNIIF
ncbi:hypothetical protein Lal_00014736 [Lupinus albus]|nr:hypothetical protein Lal_00014736 [Lupinus albus]